MPARQRHTFFRSVLAAMLLMVPAAAFAQGYSGESYVTTWRHNAKGAYSISTDDDRPTQVYTIAPSLTERGLYGTFYVNPTSNKTGWTAFVDVGDINGDGLPDGYKHLPAQGHELGSHTKEHWAVTVGNPHPDDPDAVFESYEDFEADCIEVNEYLESLTGQRVVSFSYPWGRYDGPSREIVGEHYLSGRTTGGGAIVGGHVTPNPPSPPDMRTLRAFLTEGGYYTNHSDAMLRYNMILNDTVSSGGWAIEYLHQTGNGWTSQGYGGNWSSVDKRAYYEHLDNIVEGVDDGDLWQETVGNVSRYIYSRDAATIEYDIISESSIELRVDDLLDDALFSVPLTIMTKLPESWINNVVITHNGDPIDFMLCVDPLSGLRYAKYDVLADGGPLVLMPDYASVLLGDYEGDGDVDEADYLRWRADFGTVVEAPGMGSDGNSNGMVDAGDYGVWRDHFCPSCKGAAIQTGAGASAGFAVPEPSAFVFLWQIALLAGLCRRAGLVRRPTAVS